MKIGFVSLGCPKNLVDGEVMLGLAREARARDHARRGDGRRAGREHVRLHRSRQAGIRRRDSRDGAAQARRPLHAARRHRLPGRALSRRAAGRRSRRSTPCSARARCRRSSQRLNRAMRPTIHAAALSPFFRTNLHVAARSTEPRSTRHPTYLYDAETPRAADDAAPLRLRQGRRRLRLHVRVLHHPDAARDVPQPRRRTRSSARRERWPSAA